MSATATLSIGLILVLVAVALAPLAARHLQRNGLISAINEMGALDGIIVEASPLLMRCIDRFPEDKGGTLRPGLIYAANEARFDSTYYREGLTSYTVGWRDPENLQVLLDRCFPSVSAGRLLEFKKADNAAVFLTDDDDERAIGGVFKRVETRGTTAFTKTINRGLTTRIDKDERHPSDVQERKAAWLKQRLLRNEFIRCLAILDAACHNNPIEWTVDSNPDRDFRNILRTATDASGMRPNVSLMGELAWDARLDVYESQDTPYAGRAAGMSQEALASKLMMDFIQVVKARYQASAAAKQAIVAAVAYFYTAFPGLDKDDPSNFKRFTTPCANGLPWATYIEDHPKFIDVTVEHYSGPTITSSLGLEKATITNSVEEEA